MYTITADIRYLDGFLANVDIPDGYHVTCPDLESYRRILQFIHKTRATNDFVRAVGTGHRYVFTSDPRLTLN